MQSQQEWKTLWKTHGEPHEMTYQFQIHPVFHGTVAACVVDVENVHLVLL
jgi:hypothetical protein